VLSVLPWRRGILLSLLLVALLSASPAFSAGVLVDMQPGQTLSLERYEGDVKIDGVLDESVWRELPYYDEFLVTEPDTLAETAHPTRARLFYSDKGLYIGVESDQPEDTIISRLSGRDFFPITRDSISITLDSSGTGRYGYWFEVGLGDSISDGTVLPERQFSSDWDGPWRAATSRTDTGWSAEFLIPWGTVSMPRTGDIRRMTFAISRKVAYVDERWQWPPLPFTQPQYMSAMQPMQMEGVAPRQQWNFYPYTSVNQDELENDTEFNVGADLFWRPSSNFQLNATLNPDFGAVEVDDVVINLSALETFFPEKRLFFLEGQEIFNATPRARTSRRSLGRSGPPVTMVNTRRIGGKPNPPGFPDDFEIGEGDLDKPVDLLGAFKTTGQIGAIRYGVMAAMEDEAEFDVTTDVGEELRIDKDGNDYGIARMLWENNAGGQYRALGMLSTAVRGGEGRNAYVQGVDWHYYTKNTKLQLDGQAFTSDIDDESRGYGGFMDADYSFRQGVNQRVGFEYFDRNVDLNDLGFLQRNGYWQVRTSHGRTNSDLSWARENRFDGRAWYRKNLDGDHINSGLLLTDQVTFESLRSVRFGVGFFPEAYDDRNSFGNGTYRVEEKIDLSARYASDTTQVFSWSVGAGMGEEDLGGDTYSGDLSFRWRPSDRFNAGLRLKYLNRDGWLLHQEDRNMTTFQAEQWQPVVDVEYFFSAKQQFRASLQWVGIKAREDEFFLVPEDPGDLIRIPKPDAESDDFSVSQLTFQARYRWELAPLSDLFVVYTRVSDVAERLQDESFTDVFNDGWNEPFVNSFIVKLRYRFGS
jgi:hypothetical protein